MKRYYCEIMVTSASGRQYATSLNLDFRYDPPGRQVLRAYVEHFTVSGPDQLKRESFITTGVAGNVELIHALGCQADFGSAETCGVGTLKDETFTLADGIGPDVWDVPQPLDVVSESPLSLEAPRAAVSDRLGVLPADVSAPPVGTPGAGDPADVTPPEGATPEGEAGSVSPYSPSTPLPGLLTLPGVAPSAGDDATGGPETERAGTLPGLGSLPALTPECRAAPRPTFEAAIATGRRPYFHFEGGAPRQDSLDTLRRYGNEYGVTPVIDTTPLR